MAVPPPLALRFLSGRFQGGVVPLGEERALVVGRGPDSDLLLLEEQVSRRHARLSWEGGALLLEDLGSTNGTYLNGARVTRARVAEGDRILVGGSLLKVVARDPAPAPSLAEVRASLERAARAVEPRRGSAMEGRLEEVPLVDLLQLLGTGRKTGVLAIRAAGRRAEVHLDGGRVSGCVLDGRGDLPADKAFYRLLGWTAGHFELRPPPTTPAGVPPLAGSMEGLLMEGARHLDELARLRRSLPARLAPGAAVEGLDAEDRALVALVAQHGSLEAVLDATPLTDLAAAGRLTALLARGAIRGGAR